MRKLVILGPLFLAACGGEAEAPVENQAVAAAGFQPGLWEISSEVTTFNAMDEGQPKITGAAGTTATANVCVGEDDRPPTELFSGAGYDCEYSNYYVRNGRMNITMNCSREGLTGNIAMAIDGQFEADSLEAGRDITTYLITDGDVQMSERLTGRRIGDCPAEGDSAATKEEVR